MKKETFEQAKKIVKKEKITKWKEYQKKRKEINKRLGVCLPSNPDKYAEWRGWPDFISRPPCPEFSVFRDIIHKEGILYFKDYQKQRKQLSLKYNLHMPSIPNKTYPELVEWRGFVGTDFVSYEEAKEIAQKMRIYSFLNHQERYKETYKRGTRIPCHPEKTYKDKWEGWSIFLGIRRMSMSETRIAAEFEYVFKTQTENIRNIYLEDNSKITELDIYSEDLKIAIEYDGCFYHHNTYDRDIAKYNKAKSHGITLFNIRESSSQSQFSLKAINKNTDTHHHATKSDLLETCKTLFLTISNSMNMSEDIKQSVNAYQGVDEYQNPERFNSLIKYEAYPVAQEIVVREGTKTVAQYLELCRLVRKKYSVVLPTAPFKVYADDWIGWSDFLQKN